MTDPARSKALERARAAFEAGRISACWEEVAALRPTATEVGEIRALDYLILGCALYRTGDLEAARRLNRLLPPGLWTTMRYRLSLRLRDPAQAKRLRRAGWDDPRKRDDFRTSAGLYALWQNRPRTGLPLYAARHNAVHFPPVLPPGASYVPLTDAPDAPLIGLEQGLGDVLFHLAHIKALGGHETSRFTGLPKYAPLIRRYFPRGRFVDPDQARGPAHPAGDFIARTFASTGRLSPGVLLDSPLRGALDLPVFGLCWRGGSGQNRREERHIPLGHMLDLLPDGIRLLALQHDLSEPERKRLWSDPRCMVPLADLTRNPVTVIDMIRPLAGVISVDSANWHMAGFSGVPLLAIMNPTAHWYWGPKADAASVFPTATTLPKAALSAPALAQWCDRARTAWHMRPISPPLPAPKGQCPVFICGVPRSGTSLATRILAAQGLWLGETVQGGRDNPEGFHENRRLRDTQVKPLLKALGADPRGVDPLPRADRIPPFPGLAQRVLTVLRDQGHDGRPWGFKDPKLTLLWPAFARAFPGSCWLILRRDRAALRASLARAGFMAMHSTSPDHWDAFCAAYEARLDALATSGLPVFTARHEDLAQGDFTVLRALCAHLDLPFDDDRATAALTRA